MKSDALIAYIPAGGKFAFPTMNANGMFINKMQLITIWYVRIFPVANMDTHNGPESVSMSTPIIINVHIEVVCGG